MEIAARRPLYLSNSAWFQLSGWNNTRNPEAGALPFFYPTLKLSQNYEQSHSRTTGR
jgi:hypothetical protein